MLFCFLQQGRELKNLVEVADEKQFLKEAFDTLIGALQDFYNLILDAINFIVAGIIKNNGGFIQLNKFGYGNAG